MISRLSLACVLLGVTLTSATDAISQETGSESTKSDSPAEVFRKHVSYLAADQLAGRATGTVGSAQAADYVAGHFANAGLKTQLSSAVHSPILKMADSGEKWNNQRVARLQPGNPGVFEVP